MRKIATETLKSKGATSIYLLQDMDYEKMNYAGGWLFAAGGGGLIYTSVYRLGFGEAISSMPRPVFIVSTEFMLLGILMVLVGINLCKLANIFGILKLMLGKGLFCLFVAGMMDVMLFNYSYVISLMTLALLGLGGFFIVVGVVCFPQESMALNDLRK